jgi:son of sevenless-like protein
MVPATSAVASSTKGQHRKADKLRDILGDEAPQHYLDTVNADLKPWYLRPNYSQTEILIDPDGTVKGGTVPALVERLTAHEHGGK